MAILTSMPPSTHTLAEISRKLCKDSFAPSINGCKVLCGVVHFKDLLDPNGVKPLSPP